MKAKPILVLPTSMREQTLPPAAEGYLVIFTDEPEKIAVLVPSGGVMSEDMMMAALAGLCGPTSSTERTKFVLELYRRMQAREKAKAALPGGAE